jgi:hypothetical protein
MALPLSWYSGNSLPIWLFGQQIDIVWNNALGNRNDYVAVYRPDTTSVYREIPDGLAWNYINSLPAGELQMGATNSEWDWPLGPGT